VRRVLLQTSGSRNAQHSGFLDSGFGEALARNEWYLHVSLNLFFFFRFRISYNLKLFCPAGSSLLRLTMNGGFFEAVFPAGTLYGSVTIGALPKSEVNLLI
jgi:hypothetical protein